MLAKSQEDWKPFAGLPTLTSGEKGKRDDDKILEQQVIGSDSHWSGPGRLRFSNNYFSDHDNITCEFHGHTTLNLTGWLSPVGQVADIGSQATLGS